MERIGETVGRSSPRAAEAPAPRSRRSRRLAGGRRRGGLAAGLAAPREPRRDAARRDGLVDLGLRARPALARDRRSGSAALSAASAPAKLRFRVGPIPEPAAPQTPPRGRRDARSRTRLPRPSPRPPRSPPRSRIRSCASWSRERLARASPGPGPAAISDTLPAARKTAICRAFSIGRSSLHRKGHHGPRRPRAGPASTRYVHRVDRVARPSSPRLRGGRQRRRRGARGPQRPRRRHHPSRQLGDRPRRRRGHPGRHHRRAGTCPR